MKKLSIQLGGLIIVGALVMSMDQPGASRVVFGTIDGVAVQPSDTGPSKQIAGVTLADGSKVQARVSSSSLVRAGEKVRLNEYRGIFFGRKTYEVVSAEGGT